MDQLGRHVAQESEQILAIFVTVKKMLVMRGGYFFETLLQVKYLKLIIWPIPFYRYMNVRMQIYLSVFVCECREA